MGFAPPPDLPPPPPASPNSPNSPDASATADFPPSPAATTCGFSFALPKFTVKIFIPGFKFPPKLPLPFLSLALSCDLANPINVSAGVKFGGGRVSNAPLDPDLQEEP